MESLGGYAYGSRQQQKQQLHKIALAALEACASTARLRRVDADLARLKQRAVGQLHVEHLPSLL
jgi:hypothetical protein